MLYNRFATGANRVIKRTWTNCRPHFFSLILTCSGSGENRNIQYNWPKLNYWTWQCSHWGRETTDSNTYSARDIQIGNINNYIDKKQKIQPCTARGCVSHYQLSALPPSLRGHPWPCPEHTSPLHVCFLCGCVCVCKPSCTAGLLTERRKKGQKGSVVARCGGLARFCWVTRNGRRKRRRRRRNGRMRKSEAKLPEVRDKERDMEVRKNVLGLQRYCMFKQEGSRVNLHNHNIVWIKPHMRTQWIPVLTIKP